MKKLLILGELDPTPLHLARVAGLGLEVERVGADAPAPAIQSALRASDFVIFNNIDVNPYLECFGGVHLAVLAATGYDFLDVERARRFGVRISNLLGYSTEAVVEYMLWAALSALRPFEAVIRRVRSGDWSKDGFNGRELSSCRTGIVGYGRIGSRLAQNLQALGVPLTITSRRKREVPCGRWAPLAELLETCDLIFVCCELNPSSRHMLNSDSMRLLPGGAILVSISPNEVFDLDALASFLNERPETRAVLDLDPIAPDHPLVRCQNAYITPHVAFKTYETLDRRLHFCVDILEKFIGGGEVLLISSPAACHGNGQPAVERAHAARVCEQVPDPKAERTQQLLNAASSFYFAQSLYALVKLGVPAALGSRGMSTAELAERLNIAESPLELLLLAGVSLKIVQRENGGFRSAPEYASYLTPSDPSYVGDTLLAVIETSYEAWGGLVDFVRTGVPRAILQDSRRESPNWAARLTRGSDQLSRSTADLVISHLPDRPVRRILDVGCGSAAITRRLLRLHPAAMAVLIDQKRVLDTCAEEYLAAENLLSRCRRLDRDFNDGEDFPGDNDLVIISNVLHVVGPEKAASLLHRVGRATRDGGVVVCTSFFLEDGRDAPAFSTHFALSCNLLSGNGRGYSASEVSKLFYESGLRPVRFVKLGTLVGLLIGERTGGGEITGDADR